MRALRSVLFVACLVFASSCGDAEGPRTSRGAALEADECDVATVSSGTGDEGPELRLCACGRFIEGAAVVRDTTAPEDSLWIVPAGDLPALPSGGTCADITLETRSPPEMESCLTEARSLVLLDVGEDDPEAHSLVLEDPERSICELDARLDYEWISDGETMAVEARGGGDEWYFRPELEGNYVPTDVTLEVTGPAGATVEVKPNHDQYGFEWRVFLDQAGLYELTFTAASPQGCPTCDPITVFAQVSLD